MNHQGGFLTPFMSSTNVDITFELVISIYLVVDSNKVPGMLKSLCSFPCHMHGAFGLHAYGSARQQGWCYYLFDMYA